MSIAVKIPPMGESITSGILARWHVKDGDSVQKGQILFELETDKITSEGMAETSGKIQLNAKEGDEVAIGQTVATIDETAAAPSTTAEPITQNTSAKDAVSPAVRRIAEESNLNPASVSGSGKDGRVTKGDMLQALATPTTNTSDAVKAPTPTCQPVIPCGIKTSRKKMTPLRKKIAERLVQAQQSTASLTTFNEVDLSAVMALRNKYQEAFVKKQGLKLGFMSFFTKAVVHALQAVPALNAQIDGDEIIQNHYFDIGVAVGTEKGLVVPVVRNADQADFANIEMQISNYAKKAREGKITLDDLQGGVFTISNGGIYGSMLSTPILNAPQSGILGMHSIQERPIVVNGQITIRPMMYLALTYDHRLVDGKEAVTFLIKVKEAIEDPARLLFNI